MINVIVRNYQSVEEAKVKIEGITIVRGASNAGKSSFMKALYAGTHNRFRIGCIRYGEEFCEVKVKFGESENVLSVKRKETGSPRITLGDPKNPEDSQRWSKLGRDLPTEVVDFLNFGTINVSNSEKYSLNFFPQFKAPLLAEFSQQKIMDILSASKSVDDLNKVRKEVDIRRTKNRGAFENMDAVLTEIKSNLAITQLRLDDMESLEVADALVVKREGIENRIKALESLKLSIQQSETKQREINMIQTYIELSQNRQILNSRLESLRTLRTGIQRIENLELQTSYLRNYSSLLGEKVEVGKRLASVRSFALISAQCSNLVVETDFMKILLSYVSSRDLAKARLIGLKSLRSNLIQQSYLSSSIKKGNELYNLVSEKTETRNQINELSSYLAYVLDMEGLQYEISSLKKVYEPTVKLNNLSSRKEEIKSRLTGLKLLKTTMSQYYLIKESVIDLKNIVEGNLCPLCKQPLDNHVH